MPTITVFLAPDGPAGGVLDVLTDLSAAELVSEFLWVVDSDMARDEYGRGDPDVRAVHVVAGATSETTVRSTLAELEHDRRRLCVVVPVSDGAMVSSDDEQRMSDVVSFAGQRVPTSLVRVVVARPGDHALPEVLSRNGWHNIYVAPEDAYGPGRAPDLLPRDADPVELGRHAAPAIAGLIGLWAGVDRTPLDEPHAPNGVRAGRAFYRRIDARAVEADLRDRVLSTAAPLPEPSGRTANAVYVTDPAGACGAMVARWWEVHQDRLIGLRARPETLPPVPKGLLAMLRLFFRFIWDSLRRLPWDLLDGAKIAAKAAAARQVNNLVLGRDPSSYEVVVGGVDRDGMPYSWRKIGDGIGRIDGQLAQGGVAAVSGHQEERPDLQTMWRDFADGAMTLVDGLKRGLDPLSDGAHIWVLRSTSDAAPRPHDDFEIPGQFHSEVGEQVQVGDMLGADVLRSRLEHIAEDNYTRGPEVSRTQQDLAEWRERYRQTYSAQVGGLLAHHLMDKIAEVQAHLQWLKDAANTLGSGAERPSRARTGLIWLLLVLAVLAPGAAYVLWATERVSGRGALVIGLVPAIVWLVVVVWAFVREKRQVFRDLNRRRELLSKVDAVRANLRQATIDVRRLAQAYEQYLVWSRVVGALLHQPFGPPRSAVSAGVDITYGLPRSTRIARAEVDERATGAAAAALREEIFRIGWLRPPWDEHLAGAGAQIGSYQLQNNPEALRDLRSGTADSALRRWADMLADPAAGPSAAPGDTAWRWVQELLRGRHRERAVTLFSSVREVGPGDRRTVVLREFLSGIDRPKAGSPEQEFSAVHFTAAGQAERRGVVELHEWMDATEGLNRVDVLVQLTQACNPWEFAVTEGRRRPPPPPVAPPAYPNGGSPAVPDDLQEEVTGMPPPVAPEAPSGFH